MKTYTGKIMSDGGAKLVVVSIVRPGTNLKVNYTLPHLMFHSSGLEWGYSGSGPSDLALSILADYFGESAEQVIRYANFGRMGQQCPHCDGEGWFVDDAYEDGVGMVSTTVDCTDCENGAIYPPISKAWELHHQFLWHFVAHWDQDRAWTLSETEILAFLSMDERIGMLPGPEVES